MQRTLFSIVWDTFLLFALAFTCDLSSSRVPFKVALALLAATLGYRVWAHIQGNYDREPLDVDSAMAPSVSAQPVPARVHVSAQPKRHPQFILAMDQAFFDGSHHFSDGLNALPMGMFLSWPETQSALVVRERETLERDESYRQVLPYTIVRQLGEDGATRYLAYMRGKRAGEQRLAGKVSIGFGGHIDMTSIGTTDASVINLRDTILASALREVDEELRYAVGHGHPAWLPPSHYGISFADQFITGNEGVNRVHLGVVTYLDIPAGAALECAEEELETLGMHTADDLLRIAHDEDWAIETWSKLVLAQLAQEEHAAT